MKLYIWHAIHLIASGWAESAIQVTKALEIFNQSLSTQIVQNSLKSIGMKAVAKMKSSKLTQHHRKERLDFGVHHQHWTLEGWKKFI